VPPDPRQVIDLEFSIVIEIGRDDTKEEIAVLRHQMAFNDLG
jgi:hypothetical protein